MHCNSPVSVTVISEYPQNGEIIPAHLENINIIGVPYTSVITRIYVNADFLLTAPRNI